MRAEAETRNRSVVPPMAAGSVALVRNPAGTTDADAAGDADERARSGKARQVSRD